MRKAAPSDANKPLPASLHLDPVRAFAGYSQILSKPSPSIGPNGLKDLPEELRVDRHPLWNLLLKSAPEDSRQDLINDLFCKHR